MDNRTDTAVIAYAKEIGVDELWARDCHFILLKYRDPMCLVAELVVDDCDQESKHEYNWVEKSDMNRYIEELLSDSFVCIMMRMRQG